jgi:hypothetical protein
MALQAQRRLAHIQQVRIRRTVWLVAQHAIFCYWRVLVGKWAAVLRMTAQAEFIDVRAAQVLSQRTTVRIMAIDASDLALAIGVDGTADYLALFASRGT